MSEEEPKSHIIFIANLVPTITKQQLQNIFKEYGRIISSDLIRRRAENTYAFIEFDDMRDAVDALQSVNQRQIRGKKLRIEYKNGIQNQRVEPIQNPRQDEYNRIDREKSRSRKRQPDLDRDYIRGRRSQSRSSQISRKKFQESRSKSRSRSRSKSQFTRNQKQLYQQIKLLTRRVRQLQGRVDFIDRKNRR